MAGEQQTAELNIVGVLDTRGRKCPEPNVMIKDKLVTVNAGDVLEVVGDTESKRSVARFVRMRGHETLSITEDGDTFKLVFRKSAKERSNIPASTCELK
jgi:TusA-related sulfurtransferase